MMNILNSVLDTLQIMGWMGLVLFLLDGLIQLVTQYIILLVLKETFNMEENVKRNCKNFGLFYLCSIFVAIGLHYFTFCEWNDYN